MAFRDPHYLLALRNLRLTAAVQVAARQRHLLSTQATTIRQLRLHLSSLLARLTHHSMQVGAHHHSTQLQATLVVTAVMAVVMLLAVTEAAAVVLGVTVEVVLVGPETVAGVMVEVVAVDTMVATVGIVLRAHVWVSGGIVLQRAEPLGSSMVGTYRVIHLLFRMRGLILRV